MPGRGGAETGAAGTSGSSSCLYMPSGMVKDRCGAVVRGRDDGPAGPDTRRPCAGPLCVEASTSKRRSPTSKERPTQRTPPARTPTSSESRSSSPASSQCCAECGAGMWEPRRIEMDPDRVRDRGCQSGSDRLYRDVERPRWNRSRCGGMLGFTGWWPAASGSMMVRVSAGTSGTLGSGDSCSYHAENDGAVACDAALPSGASSVTQP